MAVPISGIGGAVDGEATVREWKIRSFDVGKPYTASNTRAGVDRVCGAEDWRGVYRAYSHTPSKFPGDEFNFSGSIDGTRGVEGAAMCERISIIWDIENGGPIESLTEFARNGSLEYATSDATDTDDPDPPCVLSRYLKFGGTGEDPETHVFYMKLTMWTHNRPYVSSDTAGGVMRVRGEMDAELLYRQYIEHSTGITDTTARLETLRDTAQDTYLYVTDALYWRVRQLRIEQIDYTDPIEGVARPKNAWAEVRCRFAAFAGTVDGIITTPAESPVTKWPFT